MMDTQSIISAYRRYAPKYDFLFGAVFQPGRRTIIDRMHCRPGERVLEVGVGTGLSLPLYPRHVRITGIDLSPEMLARAETLVERERLPNVDALACMDAENMTFADSSFDRVVAMYVVSVALNPLKVIDEMRRVCKPDGDIYILNHFRHPNPVIGSLERMSAPLGKWVGFRPNLEVESLIRDAHLEVKERTQVNAFGYWTLLHTRNNKLRLDKRAAPARTAHARTRAEPRGEPVQLRDSPRSDG